MSSRSENSALPQHIKVFITVAVESENKKQMIKINLAILLYENVQPMDVIGPWEIFSFWQKVSPNAINLYLVAEKSGYIECDNRIVLKAHQDFKSCPRLDYLIVPGGQGRLTQMDNSNLINFIKTQAESCRYILSVCTGVFLLKKSGLLHHKSATTYWRALAELQADSNIHVVEQRIVKDGKIWSSGGVSSGIDLALALIAEIAGKEEAGKVQLLFEYFPDHKVYCSENTNQLLPRYQKNQHDNEILPEYIRTYITEKVKS